MDRKSFVTETSVTLLRHMTEEYHRKEGVGTTNSHRETSKRTIIIENIKIAVDLSRSLADELEATNEASWEYEPHY